MAFIFRITLGFDEPKQGWSEAWYQQRESNDCVQALDDAMNMVRARAKLLGSGALVSHLRAAVVTDLATNTHLTRLSQGRDLNEGPGVNSPLLPPHENILVRCIPIDRTLHKDVFLGGAPNTVLGSLRQFQASAIYLDKFNAWAQQIRQSGYGWLHQVKADDRQISNWEFDPNTGKTIYTLNGAITFTGNPPVRRVMVTIPGGHDSLDGVQVVQPYPAQQGTQVITAKPRPTKPYDQRIGRMVSYSYTFVSLFSTLQGSLGSRIDPQRMARRVRGRPLYAEAGRRPATVRF